MAKYVVDELAFRLPDGWVDRSVQLFASPEGGLTLNLTRHPLAGESIAALVDRELGLLERGTPPLRVLSRADRPIDGLVAHEARLAWAPRGVPCFQHQVYVPYYDVALVFTVAGPMSHAAACDALLDATLAELRLRRKET